MDAPALRWGILSTGWIATQFTAALQRSTRQVVSAVGSRDLATARRFADEHGITTAHGSYEELVTDPAVDIVYVATPHNHHFPNAQLAIAAGKHVLVEKPITLNAQQTEQLATAAAQAGVACMEALWTFFLPKFDVIRQLLEDGVLGDVQVVMADHGQYFEADHRIRRADLAGGPMLDLGTYPISLVAELLDVTTVQARGHDLPDGLNAQFAAVLSNDGGAEALVHSTILGKTPTSAFIGGRSANLSLPGDFYMPGPFTLSSTDDTQHLTYTEPVIAHSALHFQAAELARRISAGELASPLRSLDASLRTMRVMDEVRRQIGARFAEES
jgi:predicted dehydrogenase